MIELFGFPLSGYNCIVKMCLLEKDIPFVERHDDFVLNDDLSGGKPPVSEVKPAYWQKSPFGKVPCIGTAHGYLSETQIILEYLEDAYPRVPLLPTDAFARAKARELVRGLDWYLEQVIRRVYAEAFFGGTTTTELKAEVHELLHKALRGIASLTKLAPYAMGETFTYVDCVAAIHLPVVAAATSKLYGEDLELALPGLTAYIGRIAERPSYTAALASILGKLADLGMA